MISLITGTSMGTFTFLFNMLFLIMEAILLSISTLINALAVGNIVKVWKKLLGKPVARLVA